MAQTKQGLKGSEALQILELRASRDLKLTRQLVEEASMADIASYFKGAGLGSFPQPLIQSLSPLRLLEASGAGMP